MNLIKINGDEYISLNDAVNYLDEPSAAFQLKTYFFRYKGFAEMTELLDELEVCTYSYEDDLDDKRTLIIDRTVPEQVYINGLAEIKIKPITQAFHDGREYFISKFKCFIGLVNREQKKISYLNNGAAISISSKKLNLYKGGDYNDDILVKLSDLDALAEKYGIPKKPQQTPSQPPEITEIKKPEILRGNDFNTCLLTLIHDFINRNGYKPTAEIVIHELKCSPPEGEIIDFKKDNTLSINGATSRTLVNVARAINNLLKNMPD